MGTATSDEQIVERALTGDAEAFGEIVQRWERRIFVLSFGMLGREEDARDATQETFLAAFRNLRAFRGEAKVSSWLHRIAVNQCITRQRRAKVRSESALETEEEQTDTVALCVLRRHTGTGHDRQRRREGGEKRPAETGDGDRQAGEKKKREGDAGAAERGSEQEGRRQPCRNTDEKNLQHFCCPAFRAVRGGSAISRRTPTSSVRQSAGRQSAMAVKRPTACCPLPIASSNGSHTATGRGSARA